MNRGLLRPFAVRDFRLLFSGETISVVGDQFHFVALAWLTLQLTGSGLALGSVLMVAAIPRGVFMLLGGALSDRFSPRSLMLGSNAIRALLVGVIAALVLTGRAELWHLFVLAGVFGVVDAFFYPAIGAILPMLVDEETLPPANAVLQGSQQLASLIGPAAAGVLVALVNTGPAFVIDAVSFAIAGVALIFVVGGRRSPATGGSREAKLALLPTIGAGLGYAWRDPAIRSLIVLSAAFNFALTGPITVGIPYLADQRFDGGSAAFGIILSGFGAGALAGAMVAGSVPRVPRLGAVILSIGVGMGVAVSFIGLAPNVPLAFVLLGVIGLGAGFLNVHVVSWLQARTAEDMRGRVMSLVMIGSAGLIPVSYAVSGAVVDFGAVALMFAVAGAIITGASLLAMAWGIGSLLNQAPSAESVEGAA
ncbi:MAG: MFS transporter [Chloroflexota bacterium]|nr:MFS transporter [Chloroflexota bacterium]